jgi:diaminohydroxyphosphoribosylaminopyrimidine deaminase/5-amino-6-(5-phosphoribosylamino)uracil reductase
VLREETLEVAMRRAFSLAQRGPAGDTNPQVGCVLLDAHGDTVAEGWHRGAGTPHAEIDALTKLAAAWQGRERELTAVVTLEPCNHTGRTGPCAEALAAAHIGAVVFSLNDPSPVAGGGADTLRAAGVTVREGVLAHEGRELLNGWLARQGTAHVTASRADERRDTTRLTNARRPHVIVKWAQTLDGRAAAADGSSQWITGPTARSDVHRRRAEADAILVGTGTLYADDPSLTARTETGDLLVPAAEQPIPVLLGRREIPSHARLRQHPALAPQGLDMPLHYAGDDLAEHLTDLYERGVRRLFVEGGPTVASAFIAAGLADEVLVYVAPALLGGPRLALGDLGITGMHGIKRLRMTSFEQLGEDLLISATFEPHAHHTEEH